MGSGFKDFAAGDVLTANDVDGYLMRQTAMTFADASARDTALSGVLDEGMVAYLEDVNRFTFYDGSAWKDIANATNSGLVLVKTQTIGSGVSSVTVTSAFSSAFDDYLVTLTGTAPSSGGNFTFSFDSAHTSGYYGRYKDENYLGTVTVHNRNDAPNLFVGNTNPAPGSPSVFINVCSPALATRHSIFGNGGSGAGFAIYGGEYGVTNTFTGFYMTVTVGTMTGGTIRVYGYNNG